MQLEKYGLAIYLWILDEAMVTAGTDKIIGGDLSIIEHYATQAGSS
jgi:hypothetical protein